MLIQLIESWLDSFPVKKQADLLGLEYAGYGRWKDQKTGKIVAKTVGDKLYSIAGTGDHSVVSPSDSPNIRTAQPIAGDSADGHNDIEGKHDSYIQEPTSFGRLFRSHTDY